MFFRGVKTAPLPKESGLWHFYKPGDFIDGYQTKAPFLPRRAAEIAMAFPRWVTGLLTIRQIIMSPFGLKGRSSARNKIAIFPVTQESEREMVLGFDDRHLNFRIAVLSRDGHIHFATWVHHHNWLGRAYLFVVMPFHILITKNMMARVARHARAGLN